MDKFEFDGDWEREVRLIEFAKLNHPDFARTDHDAKNGVFGMTIYDERNFNPDPEEVQINTINYLLERKNQREIIESIFHYARDIIYPEYKNFLPEDEYPEAYPTLKSSSDLYDLIGINEVLIYKVHKDGFAYYVLGFNSCLDYEHGLYITLHQSRVLDYDQMGDFNQEKVYEDLGIDYKKYREELFNKARDNNTEDPRLYDPHPKYGKLKPWQQGANDSYANTLLHRKKHDKLLEFLKDDSNRKKITGRLLKMCLMNGFTDSFELLIELKPKNVVPAILEATRKNKNEIVKRLVDLEQSDLNERVGQSSLLYKAFSNLANNYHDPIEKKKAMEILDLFFSIGINPNLKDKWNRDTYYCIGIHNSKELTDEFRKLLKEKIIQYGIN